MTDAEFQAHADSNHFSSMDKKTMLNVLSNIEKIFNNIPKDELNGIKNAMLKELKEHPDEFMKALRTGQLPAAFLTDGLVASSSGGRYKLDCFEYCSYLGNPDMACGYSVEIGQTRGYEGSGST